MTSQVDGSTCECPEGRDDWYHCKKCDACCFGWGTFKEPNETYEDQGICLECAMKDGLTLEEASYLVSQ